MGSKFLNLVGDYEYFKKGKGQELKSTWAICYIFYDFHYINLHIGFYIYSYKYNL